MTTAGLVLAAGAGRRYGEPKAGVIIDGVRLVDRAVAVLRDAGCEPVVVVLGAWIDDVPGAVVVENPEWDEGMGSSLRHGLAHLLKDTTACRVAITLVDIPDMNVDVISRVLASEGDVAVATYDGTQGHPVVIAREHWQAVIDSASGDRGARDFLKQHRNVDRVEVGDLASGEDLDVPPDQRA